MNQPNFPEPDSTPGLGLRALAGWLAAGLVAQTSLVLLPIGNYPTLVYWLFYAPALILAVWQHRSLSKLLRQSDRILVFLLLGLLSWTSATALWAAPETSSGEMLIRSAKHSLLILVFIGGIAYLNNQFPGLLRRALVAAIVIVAVSGLISLIDQYLLRDRPLTTRLTAIGIADWTSRTNSVVSGIYFGTFAIMASALSLAPAQRIWVRVGLGLCAAACLFAALLTGTRTAAVAIAVTVVIYLTLQGRFAAAVGISGTAIALLVYGAVEDASWLHDYLTRGGVGSWRPEIWLASLKHSSQDLILGTGLWSDFKLEVVRGTRTSIQPHSHNYYLQLLNWTGIPGLVTYLLFLGRALFVSYSARSQPLATLGFAVLVYFSVVQVFDVYDVFTDPSYYWPSLWLPIGIVFGLTGPRLTTPEQNGIQINQLARPNYG